MKVKTVFLVSYRLKDMYNSTIGVTNSEREANDLIKIAKYLNPETVTEKGIYDVTETLFFE